MRSWKALIAGIGLGIATVLVLTRASLIPNAEAQHLNRLQNVEFDFDTTGQASTLSFFNKDTGEIFLYVASTSGKFVFAKRLSLQELGGPIADQALQRLQQVPQLPSGIESDY